MTKWIYALALLAPLAFAQPNQDHTCQGGHNCNEGGGGSNEQQQGQAQGQAQGQLQGQQQHSESHSDATANAGAAAHAGSNSYSGGNTVDVHTGRSTSSAQAGGGSAVASGGNSVSHGGSGGRGGAGGHGGAGGESTAHGYGGEGGAGGSVGDTSASSGGNSQDITVEGDTDNSNTAIVYEDAENAASSAASVFAGYCQTGVSGQIVEGGFSIIHTEQFCNHIRLADVMYQAYEREKTCKCVGVCTTKEASASLECKISEKGQKFLDAYYDNLLDAQSLIEVTEGTSKVDAVSKQLFSPALLIGALIWLI